MWSKATTTFLSRFHLTLPIIQAPMAGGASTPKLVATVSNKGGLGSLAAGYLDAAATRKLIQDTKALTNKPISVNLFVPQQPEYSETKINSSHALLQAYRTELGINTPPSLQRADFFKNFQDQIQVLIAQQISIVSFTFGLPDSDTLNLLKNSGISIFATATTVNEAIAAEKIGCDLIVAQGSEAGGHRGTFLHPVKNSLIGTMALVPQLIDAVNIPVIAAGGIMDGRGLAAAVTLGASAAQMGTAFLTCEESGIHPKYKEEVLKSNEESTGLTKAFTGKMARGINTKLINDLEPYQETLPDYPLQNAVTQDIRQEAAKQARPEFMFLLAGQGTRLSKLQTASQLMDNVMVEAEQAMDRQLFNRPNKSKLWQA